MKSKMKHIVSEGGKVSGFPRNIWKGENMSRDAKRSIYEGTVVPTLPYGIEVWATSADDIIRMGMIEMKFIRAICGVIIMARVRNE
jgi:hypothetical protein